jgi:hypothetical protein
MAGLVAVLGPAVQTPLVTRPLPLSAVEIRSALSWAASGSPKPYAQQGTDGRTVGVIYTATFGSPSPRVSRVKRATR